MKVLATHEQIDGLLRKLHAADVSAVLLRLTGPGWIVEMPDYVDVDLSGYQAVSR